MDDFFKLIEWSPKIGDPSFIGWFTVFAYFAAFIVSLKVVAIEQHIFSRRRVQQKRLWQVIALLMLLLAINKQLDLQSFLTAMGRYLFRLWDIYEYKRDFQILFIACIGISSLIILSLIVKSLYKVIHKHLYAIAGLVFLFAFVFIRASSFHNFDALISYSFLGFKLNWLFELGGIGLIIYNAFKLIERKKKIKIVKKKKNTTTEKYTEQQTEPTSQILENQ